MNSRKLRIRKPEQEEEILLSNIAKAKRKLKQLHEKIEAMESKESLYPLESIYIRVLEIGSSVEFVVTRKITTAKGPIGDRVSRPITLRVGDTCKIQ